MARRLARHCAPRRMTLFLMDLQMPVMGGLEATCRIRERELLSGQHVPIVAMTAHAAAQDEKRCLEAGMDGYLTKTIRREVLRKEIDRAVTQSGSAENCSEAPPHSEISEAEWNVPRVAGNGSRETRTSSRTPGRCSVPTVNDTDESAGSAGPGGLDGGVARRPYAEGHAEKTFP